MEHLLLKAATTVTDEGIFEAVISTIAIDREKDIVDPDGLVKALHKWTPTGKNITLAWNHSTAPEDQVGHIKPATARNVNGEVVVKGWIDQSIERGQHAWRLVKSGTLGFSYGYLILDNGATKRPGGGLHIKDLDVFEITATPIPANNETRVLGWKSVEERDAVLTQLQEVNARLDTLGKDVEDLKNSKTVDETTKEPETARVVDPLRQQAEALALDVVSGGLSKQPTPKHVEPPPAPEPTVPLDELKQRSRDLMLQVLSGIEEQ